MIVYEAFTRHLFKIVVTACHSAATDVKFTDYTYRQFITVSVDDEFLHVQLRLTHSHHFGMSELLVVRRHSDLCRTIAVENACFRYFPHLFQQLIRELFTAGTTDVHLADGLAEVVACQPCLPARGSTRHHINMLFINQVGKIQRIVCLFFSCQYKCLAIEVGHTYIL